MERLTERECQVLEALVHGKKQPQIARELGISVRTVNYHVNKIHQKTGTKNMYKARATAMGDCRPYRIRDEIYSQLNQPQRDILLLLTTEDAHKDIAAKMKMAKRTLDFHLMRMYRLLGVNNAYQALDKALESNFQEAKRIFVPII